jgi:hypothetical protein
MHKFKIIKAVQLKNDKKKNDSVKRLHHKFFIAV